MSQTTSPDRMPKQHSRALYATVYEDYSVTVHRSIAGVAGQSKYGEFFLDEDSEVHCTEQSLRKIAA